MAKARNVSAEAILIAWILRHPAKVQAIIGTTQPERIASACQGDGVELTARNGTACSPPDGVRVCRKPALTCGRRC